MKNRIKTDERINGIDFIPEFMVFRLVDGRAHMVPINWYPRLENATEKQRQNFEIVDGGFTARWDELDEDIEINGVLAGNPAPEVRMPINTQPQSIRAYRDNTSLSQSDLAAQLGVRTATISDWEKGKIQPSPLAKAKLSELIRRAQLALAPMPTSNPKPLADILKSTQSDGTIALGIEADLSRLRDALTAASLAPRTSWAQGAFPDLSVSLNDICSSQSEYNPARDFHNSSIYAATGS